MTSMEGEESWFSDAPSTSPPMDTDREVGEESKEPIGSEEGADGQMSPEDKPAHQLMPALSKLGGHYGRVRRASLQ